MARRILEGMRKNRKLDVLFAEEFLGCRVRWRPTLTADREPYCACFPGKGRIAAGRHNDPSEEEPTLPRYSTDLSYTWDEIVRDLKPDHFAFWHLRKKHWQCQLWVGAWKMEAVGINPAAALVKAALLSKGKTDVRLLR